jgi:Family of unknown function (DUF6510)
MKDNDLRLDGNAAGGMLNEVFPFEMTAAATTCSGCGAIKPVGELMLYGHGMGAILRCTGCDTVLMRITHIRGCYRLDLSGMTCLRIGSEIH